MSAAEDWRLSAHVGGLDAHPDPVLSLIHRHRHSKLLSDLDAAVSERVVITHDGERLFAYAPDREAIEAAGRAIETALSEDGVQVELTLSRWDRGVDEWVDPNAAAPSSGPVGGEQSRTLVALVGKEIRGEFERSLERYASELGIACTITEHPHLLSSQVSFTIVGTPRKLDEFAAGLAAEERQTIRTERAVMSSPL